MRKIREVTFSLVLILLLCVTMVRITRGTPSATLYVDPTKNTGWPLDTAGGHGYNDFMVNINVDNVENLYAWGFWLHWNPAVLNLTDYYEGAFVKGPFYYGTHPLASESNITVTDYTNAFDQDDGTYASLNYGQETYGRYDSHPLTHTETGFPPPGPIDGDLAYDLLNSTSGYFFGNADAQFTMKFFGTYDLHEVVQVDLKMRFNATATDNEYRIVYYVSPSATKQVLVDWTSSLWETNTTVWSDISEPNDGSWSWTDVGNINFAVETKLVNDMDWNILRVFEAWATVKYKDPVYGTFDMVGFEIPLYHYTIDRVDLKMKCSAQVAIDDEYRIVYYVRPSTEKQILIDWTSSSLALNTYEWLNIAEPNDGFWDNWIDVSNINFAVETKKVGTTDNSEIRVYEAWAVVKYHRDMFTPPADINYTTGYMYFGSTAIGDVDGVTGSGTLAMLRFVVLTSGTSVLEFASPAGEEISQLLNAYNEDIIHTLVDGSFTAPPLVEDINGDGYVDILDMSLAAIGWGKKSTDSDWSKYKDADVNKDNKIDISDLSQIAVKLSIESYL